MKTTQIARGILLFAFIGLIICGMAMANENAVKIIQTIDDMAKLGVLTIDKHMNLVGVGWEDRGKWGIGQERIVKEIVAIGLKYGVDLTKYKGKVLVGTRDGGGEGVGSGDSLVYLEFPGEWHEIVSFPDFPKLPVVKFRSGKVTMYLKQMKIAFSSGTECMINGKIFTRVDEKWVLK